MAARRRWVAYSEVKKAVSLEQVLEHYGVREGLVKRGDELVGPCPIHRGSNSRQFKANRAKNAFKCFGCRAGGNILDLVAAMEQVEIRQAALLISDWFAIGSTGPERPSASRAVAPKPT